MKLNQALLTRHNIEVAVFMAGALVNLFLVASIFAMVFFNGKKIQANRHVIKENQQAIFAIGDKDPDYKKDRPATSFDPPPEEWPP